MTSMSDMSYLCGWSAVKPIFDTIPSRLEYWSRSTPNKSVCIFYDGAVRLGSITYSELLKECKTFACSLKKAGIKRGDFVGILPSNSVEYLIAWYGGLMIGVVPLTLYWESSDITQAQRTINRVSAKVIVRTYHDQMEEASWKELLNICESLEMVISLDCGNNIGPMFDFKSFCEYSNGELDEFDCDPEDIAVILQSSGTTGEPKLVKHTHNSWLRMFEAMSRDYPKGTLDVLVSAASFGWIVGSPALELITGGTRVTNRQGQHLSVVKNFFTIIENEKCTAAITPVSMLNAISLMDEIPKFPACLRCIITGGAIMKKSYSIMLDQVEWFVVLYGSLECGFASNDYITKPRMIENNTAGYPNSGVEVKIVDDNGKIVKRETTGHVYTRSIFMFSEYHHNKKLTQSSKQSNGWYNMQDIGFVSTDGKLYIKGRAGDLIMRGDDYVYCSDAENALRHLPGVADIAVTAVPDPIMNEEIYAFVIPKTDSGLTNEKVKELVSTMKAEKTFYAPKYFEVVEKFPFNANGKLDRKLLTKIAVENMKEENNNK